MTDHVMICATAFALYAVASIRRMDGMPAVLTLDGFDFSWRHPIRMGGWRLHLPNVFRPDACLIARPRSSDDVSRLRDLSIELVPYQIASIVTAAILFVGIPIGAARTSLLFVLLAAYAASSTAVVTAFAVSGASRGFDVFGNGMARVLVAAAISPPTAINLARDVARIRQIRR